MFDSGPASNTSGYKFSDLTEEDLKTISEAEQKLSRHHNSNQVLIAYDTASGDTGARS